MTSKKFTFCWEEVAVEKVFLLEDILPNLIDCWQKSKACRPSKIPQRKKSPTTTNANTISLTDSGARI